MPLLYSESERAFLCLQHEIIKKTNDRSIFLWTAIEKSHTSFCNLFARSAAEFALFDDYDLLTKYGRFEVTQSSLEINCPLIKVPRSSALEFFGVIIDAGKGYHCVCLQQIGQDKYAHVDADEISHILNPNYNPFAKNPRRQSQRIIIPHTIDNFTYECCIDSRLGGFHVEYCPIELQIHSVTPSYAWDEGTKTLKLDCSKSIELFEDKENSLKIVFSEISHPYTTFEVNLRNEMQSPVALRTIGRSSSNDIYGYVVRVTQRFIGDKMMNVVRIDYSINDEGKWEANAVFNGLVVDLYS
jgi:hypothetical protein